MAPVFLIEKQTWQDAGLTLAVMNIPELVGIGLLIALYGGLKGKILMSVHPNVG